MISTLKLKCYSSILILLCSLALSSCKKDIDLDLKNDKTRLVVEGTINIGGGYVRLTTSGGYFDNRPMEPVSGAIVTVSDQHNAYILNEHPDYHGFYIADTTFRAIPNTLYKLQIDNVDLKKDGNITSYHANAFMHAMHEVEKIDLRYNNKWELWEILLYSYLVKEPVSYYMFKPYYNGQLLANGVEAVFVTDTRFYSGEFLEGYWASSIENFDLDEGKLKEGDQVCLEVSRIDKAYYDFLISARKEAQPQLPIFSAPPANINGNISNGALGVFTAYSSAIACYVHKE